MVSSISIQITNWLNDPQLIKVFKTLKPNRRLTLSTEYEAMSSLHDTDLISGQVALHAK